MKRQAPWAGLLACGGAALLALLAAMGTARYNDDERRQQAEVLADRAATVVQARLRKIGRAHV